MRLFCFEKEKESSVHKNTKYTHWVKRVEVPVLLAVEEEFDARGASSVAPIKVTSDEAAVGISDIDIRAKGTIVSLSGGK